VPGLPELARRARGTHRRTSGSRTRWRTSQRRSRRRPSRSRARWVTSRPRRSRRWPSRSPSDPVARGHRSGAPTAKRGGPSGRSWSWRASSPTPPRADALQW